MMSLERFLAHRTEHPQVLPLQPILVQLIPQPTLMRPDQLLLLHSFRLLVLEVLVVAEVGEAEAAEPVAPALTWSMTGPAQDLH